MRSARLAADPLWRCLCPSWTEATQTAISRLPLRPKQAPSRRLFSATQPGRRHHGPSLTLKHGMQQRTLSHHSQTSASNSLPEQATSSTRGLEAESNQDIYNRLRLLSHGEGGHSECCEIAEYLVRERQQKPNMDIYNALIMSNISDADGSAWRVSELLEEMAQEGLQPDLTTCHAILKVLAVHPDHLLRADTLALMRERWYRVMEDGEHDMAASMWRSGLYEQALSKMDQMRAEGVLIEPWLRDLAVHCLCLEGEVAEATKMMRDRHEGNEALLSSRQTLWNTLLDAASYHRHYGGTYLAWTTQVRPGYLNPSSGACLNAMATAAKTGDAALATEIFSHLSKRAIQFLPVHYELLVLSYMSSEEPDLERALAVLTIMAKDKFDVTSAETRSIAQYVRQDPEKLVPVALEHLRKLHNEARRVPPAALNMLIESFIITDRAEHSISGAELQAALVVYKQMHTFASSDGKGTKAWANIETFNLLLKGCRKVDPPDSELASFLASELLTLRIRPTALTFDRLILVFTAAARREAEALSHPSTRTVMEGSTYVDWAWRHFCDMHSVGYVPRGGTVRELAIELARVGSEHCWDLLQMAEDMKDRIESWDFLRAGTRRLVEQAWEAAKTVVDGGSGSRDINITPSENASKA